jgi:hypothetical protein
MRRLSCALVALSFTLPAVAADLPCLLKAIKAVAPEGAGSAEAATAWRELSRRPATDLPLVLAALDNASPAAGNWLRSAADAIAERERNALPVAALEAFLRDTRHAGRSRWLAYDLLRTADPTAPKRLLPTMLDDPGAELRYEAVAAAVAAVESQPVDSAAATTELHKLLAAARDGKQVEAIARALGRRGESVDLVKQFGFITGWQVAGVYDNTGGRGFRTAYPPERGVNLDAEHARKVGEVVWRPATADKAGTIDLNRVFDDRPKAVVAYAYAEVDSPVERSVHVRAASATAIKVFINGREVLAREMYHQSFDRDMHIARARLIMGRNAVLVKVCQNDRTEAWAQNWMFQLRLTDELGATIPLTVVTK